LTVVWSDFDGDGHLDLFQANDAGRNYLYQNDGKGHFTDIGFSAGVSVSQDGYEQANMGVALGDYRHIGLPSIVISHFSDEYAAFYENRGEMNFSDISYSSGIAASTAHYVGWGDAFFDLDNDGWLDLLIMNGHVYPQVDSGEAGARYQEPGLLFFNQRDGKFKDISKLVGPDLQTPRVSRGVAVGDLFNDGRIDIVVENLKGQPTVLRPEGGPANHWIGFELLGKTNRLALNARVKVTAGDLVQTGEVRSGGSYLSQNDLRLHFGLGDRDRIDKLEIIWPAGKVETLTGLAADHSYEIQEGEGVVSPEKVKPSPPKF
jgi:hypothetical protein